MLCKSLFLYVSKLSVLTDFASVMHDRYQSYCGSVSSISFASNPH